MSQSASLNVSDQFAPVHVTSRGGPCSARGAYQQSLTIRNDALYGDSARIDIYIPRDGIVPVLQRHCTPIRVTCVPMVLLRSAHQTFIVKCRLIRDLIVFNVFRERRGEGGTELEKLFQLQLCNQNWIEIFIMGYDRTSGFYDACFLTQEQQGVLRI